MAIRKLEVEILGDASSLERAFGRASKSGSSLGRSMASLGKHAAIAGAVLGTAAVAGITKSVQAASNLEEQINKANVVFGKSGKEVIGWSKTLVGNFGLSSRAALEAAGTFGNMLVPMGFTRTEAGKMSKQFVELAGDMASFNNASPEDTLLAIRSGIAGQSEPLRRFGVFLNEARVASEGVALGLVKQGQKMTEAQKATARYSLIMKDTSDTQGDFARTSDSLANAQRSLSAGVENISAQLGRVFLPAIAGAVSGLSKFVTKFSEAGGVRAKLNVVWEGIQDVARGLFEKVISAIRAIDWSAVGQAVQSGIARLGGALQKIWNAIDWNAVGQTLTQGFQSALAFISSIDFAGIIGGVASRIYAAFIAVIQGIDWGAVGQAIGKFVVDALNKIADFVNRTDWNKVGQQIVAGFKLALIAFGTFLAGVDWLAVLGATFRAAVAVIKGLFSLFFGIMRELGLEILKGLAAGLVGLARLTGEQLQKVPAALRALAGAIPGAALAVGVAIVVGIARGLAALVSMGLAQLQKLPGILSGIAGQAAGWAAAIGRAIVSGILSGMSGLFSSVKDKIIGGVKGAIDGAMGVFGHSPQEVIGFALVEGILRGWESRAGKLKESMQTKITEAVDAARSAIGNAQAGFASAFGDLMSNALSAFDAKASLLETRTEKLLRLMDEATRKADLKGAISQAQKDLQAAQAAFATVTPQAGEDDATFNQRLGEALAKTLAAQKTLDDALAAQSRFRLEQQALKERKALDDRLALRRRHFEEDLLGLQNYASRHALTAEQLNERLIAIFGKYRVPFKKAAIELGSALAEGLREAAVEVGNQAAAVRNEIMKHLSNIQVRINVDVVVPDKPDRRQHGGPVKRRQPYLVGEAGPELFIPNSSGRIVANSASMAGGSAVGGGGITINFPNYIGSRQELVEEVRRGLYDVSRRNPGALPGIA